MKRRKAKTVAELQLMRKKRGAARGEAHHNSKLTWEDVRLARELYEEHNVSIAELARKFDVHWNTMDAIVKYRAW